jgi:hypothetical protein
MSNKSGFSGGSIVHYSGGVCICLQDSWWQVNSPCEMIVYQNEQAAMRGSYDFSIETRASFGIVLFSLVHLHNTPKRTIGVESLT